MQPLIIEGTGNLPAVQLDPGRGLFEISGKSLPEHAAEFYRPVLAWLHDYSQSPLAKTVFVFRFEYFNTATSRIILDILYALEPVSGAEVHWYFHDDDEDLEEAVEEFAELVKLPFVMKVY